VLSEHFLKMLEVTREHRAEGGIDYRRRNAAILADDGSDLVRKRDEGVRQS
jgi:hypothetical protein